jgi:uncharacterized caspase-like protein
MMKFAGLPGFYRALLAVALLLLCQPAWAGKRVALVIGNAAYQNAPTLPNPVNDGAVIATTLKDAGFDVVDSRHDLSAVEMRRALRDFSDRARDADIALIYYAGHGLEVDGNNYLIPVDAKLERDADVYDEGLSLDRVLVAIEPAKQLRLVILDACRDNPFAKSMKRTMVSRSIERGLAKVEPTSPNTLIAYSAKAGSTALDGDSKNSPFTTALSKHLTTPGLDVRRAFGYVRDDVLKTTGNRQEPFVYGSLGGEDVPLVPAKPVAAAPSAAPASNPQIEARHDYELAVQIGNKDALNAFLAQHPDGYYANLARIQLAKVEAEETRVVATEKARLAEQERARLAADSAQTSQQLKAAEAEAKSAEQARIAAEKAKQVALDEAADAERKRVAAEAAQSSGRTAASNNNVVAATVPAASPPPAPPKQQADTRQTDVAALTPGPAPQVDLGKSVQLELRRVGCLSGPADGDWNAATKRSLSAFNRNAGTKLDVKTASLDTLDTIKKKDGRVCPPACDHGFRADGDHCSKIVCAEGSFLNEDNACEKRHGKTPTAKKDREREADRNRDREVNRERDRSDYRNDYRDERAIQEQPVQRARPPRISARDSGGTGQIVCGVVGCHAVAKGCHIEYHTTAQGGPIEGGGGNVQVCN